MMTYICHECKIPLTYDSSNRSTFYCRRCAGCTLVFDNKLYFYHLLFIIDNEKCSIYSYPDQETIHLVVGTKYLCVKNINYVLSFNDLNIPEVEKLYNRIMVLKAFL